MDKKEFLEQLSNSLGSLPKEERDEALLYYEEFFEDAGTVYEQDVINELGSPQKLAESIMNDSAINDERGLVLKQNFTENTKSKGNSTSYKSEGKTYSNTQNANNSGANTQGNTQKSQQKDNTSLIVGIIILAVTAPIWASVLGSILAVILSVILTVATTVLTLGVLGIVLFFVGIVYLFITPSAGLVFLGVSFVSLGITTLVFTPLLKFFIWLGKLVIKGCKSLFNLITGKTKRGEVQ
ncbi:MAG TPA: DUF1700 domain-containing protein [Clostridiales bacterium]|nr:DUF1700 domain-containing protein [Clostridiales bacterium]